MQEDSSHKHSQRTVSAAMCRKSWKRVTNLVFNQLRYNLRLTQNIEGVKYIFTWDNTHTARPER